MNKTNPIDMAMRACGCKQVEFAERMGVSPGLVSMWRKRGYITQKNLAKAVEITGLPPHVLNPFVPVVKTLVQTNQ